jgi:hypothetical protein
MQAIQGGFFNPKKIKAKTQTVHRKGLGAYLSSPGVSTSPTPDVGNLVDLSKQIDLSTSITRAANALGLVSPSVQNQLKSQVPISSRGKVGGMKTGSKLIWIAGFGVIAVIALVALD